jgi:peptide/nickel transport system permease protein
LMQSIIVVAVMSLIVFVGVNIVGDPVDMLINPEADQAEIARVIRDLGLDRPVHEQYLYFIKNAFQGDLGKSFVFGVSALKLIVQRIPATFELALSALLMAVIIGVPLGVYAGMRPNAISSRTIMAGSISRCRRFGLA